MAFSHKRGVATVSWAVFFPSRRRHTRWTGDWSSDVCSSDLGWDPATLEPADGQHGAEGGGVPAGLGDEEHADVGPEPAAHVGQQEVERVEAGVVPHPARTGLTPPPAPPRPRGAPPPPRAGGGAAPGPAPPPGRAGAGGGGGPPSPPPPPGP